MFRKSCYYVPHIMLLFTINHVIMVYYVPYIMLLWLTMFHKSCYYGLLYSINHVIIQIQIFILREVKY